MARAPATPGTRRSGGRVVTGNADSADWRISGPQMKQALEGAAKEIAATGWPRWTSPRYHCGRWRHGPIGDEPDWPAISVHQRHSLAAAQRLDLRHGAVVPLHSPTAFRRPYGAARRQPALRRAGRRPADPPPPPAHTQAVAQPRSSASRRIRGRRQPRNPRVLLRPLLLCSCRVRCPWAHPGLIPGAPNAAPRHHLSRALPPASRFGTRSSTGRITHAGDRLADQRTCPGPAGAWPGNGSHWSVDPHLSFAQVATAIERNSHESPLDDRGKPAQPRLYVLSRERRVRSQGGGSAAGGRPDRPTDRDITGGR